MMLLLPQGQLFLGTLSHLLLAMDANLTLIHQLERLKMKLQTRVSQQHTDNWVLSSRGKVSVCLFVLGSIFPSAREETRFFFESHSHQLL